MGDLMDFVMFGQGDGLIEEKALAVAGTAEAERLTGLLEYEQQDRKSVV